MTAIAFGIASIAGGVMSALGLAAGFRAAGVRRVALPGRPSGRLVLDGSKRPLWTRALMGSGFLCLLASIGIAVFGSLDSRPAVAVAAILTLAVIAGQINLDRRLVDRLEIDAEKFRVGDAVKGKSYSWVHVTELRADEDVIRFRLNRALVRGSRRRYWDGAIRNGGGVETRQLLRLLQRYREQAMETAPHYLTGRAEKSPS